MEHASAAAPAENGAIDEGVVELRMMRVGDGGALAMCYYSERTGAVRRLGAREARAVRDELRAAYTRRWPTHVFPPLEAAVAADAPARPPKRGRA